MLLIVNAKYIQEFIGWFQNGDTNSITSYLLVEMLFKRRYLTLSGIWWHSDTVNIQKIG